MLGLWIICILLFGAFKINKSRYEKIMTQINSNLSNSFAVVSSQSDKTYYNSTTLVTFKKFLMDLNHNLFYDDLYVKDKTISMEILIEDRADYYNIVKQLDSSSKYNIVDLSAIISKDNKLSFTLSLEVLS